MEISGVDPELTICKIAVLPIKLYPLVNKEKYPKKDLNLQD
jgi:hypothetical protein